MGEWDVLDIADSGPAAAPQSPSRGGNEWDVVSSEPMQPKYGQRQDGMPKGQGFLGELNRPDGGVSTELTIGVNIDGKDIDIPSLVPTLTEQEKNHLLGGGRPTREIVNKAVDHAVERKKSGEGVFADYALKEGQPSALPESGQMAPGESTSVLTGKPVSEQEMLKGGKNASLDSESFVRPALEFGGMAAGGVVGAPAGPFGLVAGEGMGYALGKNVADAIYKEDQPESVAGAVGKAGKDTATGTAMSMGGQIVAPVLPWVFGKAGEAVKAVHGRLTGLGKEATEQALAAGGKMGANPFKNYSDFDEALRGKITGEEVVKNAQAALQKLKDQRGAVYTEQLQELSANKQPIDMRPMGNKIANLLKRYVRVDASGAVDWERSALGAKNSEGVNKIRDIMDTLATWGSRPEDATPAGLDMLKRQMDGFYSESSQARAFVTSLRGIVKDTLVKEVPQYAKMTKGYEEATRIVKDIESGLMMRKQGMSGRIVADQTLRRLLSSMKDNFELRKDLVRVLSQEGEDISGQIAGYGMRSVVPVGLAGTGPAILGSAVATKFLSPAFWPVLASSSPRLSAEFLRVYGKGLSEIAGTGPMIGKTMSYSAGKKYTNSQNGDDSKQKE